MRVVQSGGAGAACTRQRRRWGRRDGSRRSRPALGRAGRRRGDRRAPRRSLGVIAVIQFDAASASPAGAARAEKGGCPTWRGCGGEGTEVELETPAEHFPASAYQDLYRGVEVGDHGLFYPFQWAAGDQRIRLAAQFRRAAADLGPARPRRAQHPGDRPLRVPPPAAAEGELFCGWGMRERVVLERWAVPDGGDREAAPAPRPPARRDRGLRRPDPARTAAPARALPRAPPPGSPTWRSSACASAVRPRLDRLRRAAPRRPPALGIDRRAAGARSTRRSTPSSAASSRRCPTTAT